MRLSDVEKRARASGVTDTWKFSKKELIRLIQRKEGNTDCFADGRVNCAEAACCWRSECMR